jgi:bleomycin hydrolase
MSKRNYSNVINDRFAQKCRQDFHKDENNVSSRNAVAMVGSMLSTTNSNKVNDIHFNFMNTIKKRHLKATDQGQSGRCWLFAGLNVFRHTIIHALDLDHFEFSAVYLYFWDKWERSNTYLQWFIDHPGVSLDDRKTEHIQGLIRSDGGFYSYFANLVEKYGLIPSGAMTETWQSKDSDDMNDILVEYLDSCVNTFINNKQYSTINAKMKLKTDTLKKIYNILVKFLGEPPKTFKWAYTNGDSSNIIDGFTPMKFKNTILPHLDVSKDYVTLSNIPSMKMNQMYEIEDSTNIVGCENVKLLNVNMNTLMKYTTRALLSESKTGVWFGADVMKQFNYYLSALDPGLDDSKRIMGKIAKFTRGDRVRLHTTETTHAMVFTGINVDSDGKAVEFAVENSWGYCDEEVAGLDGWLYMSHDWFREYVGEIVIHKNILMKTHKSIFETQTPIIVPPWNVLGKLKISGTNAPKNYIQKMKIGHDIRNGKR